MIATTPKFIDRRILGPAFPPPPMRIPIIRQTLNPAQFPALLPGKKQTSGVDTRAGYGPIIATTTPTMIGNGNFGIAGLGTQAFGILPINESNIEPRGTIPWHKRGRLSGWGEPAPISSELDNAKIQAAIRVAERGEITLLFQIYRDLLMNGGHLQCEFFKRKNAVIGQPYSITAYKARGQKKATPEDEQAAFLIEDMIENCENWNDGLLHLMDAALYPVAALEKIYEPNKDDTKPWLRLRLKRLDPVSHFLECYKKAYLAWGGFTAPLNAVAVIGPNTIPLQYSQQGETFWDPDQWENELTFFRTFPNGMINYNFWSAYAPDPVRHIIHRGNMLSRTIRDNFGGLMRSAMWWQFFFTLGRDWFARAMAKYGHPFPVVKANTQDVNIYNAIKKALQEGIDIGGLVLPETADAVLEGINGTNLAEGYKIFEDFCNGEISKIILGHEGAATAKAEGLNSNQEKTVENVRQDIRIFDQRMLRTTLEQQLFLPYLRINGYTKCHCPMITWGGLSEEDGVTLLTQIKLARDAGLELTDEGIEHVNEVAGMPYRRAGTSSIIQKDELNDPAEKEGELVNA